MAVTLEQTERLAPIQDLALGLFFDPESVEAVASSFVRQYADFRKHSSQIMDTLVRELVTGSFSLRLTAVQGVLKPRAEIGVNAWLEILASIPVALHSEYIKEHQLVHLGRALVALASHPTQWYRNQYTNDAVRGSGITLESFEALPALNALAWPSLLVAVCYLHFLDGLRIMVARGEIEESFAQQLVQSGSVFLQAHTRESESNLRRVPRINQFRLVPYAVVLNELRDILGALEELTVDRCYVSMHRIAKRLSESIEVYHRLATS